jgi:hypothetical protein
VDLSKAVQDKHVKSIFRQWLVNSSLPQGAIEALKNVALVGFRSLYYYNSTNSNSKPAARRSFFKLHTDLYTVDVNFESNSGDNIATSLDLSRYEFTADSNDSDVEK